MAVVGLSLILASVVYLFIRPPPWLSAYLSSWQQPRIEGIPGTSPQPTPPSPQRLKSDPTLKVDRKDDPPVQGMTGMRLTTPIVSLPPVEMSTTPDVTVRRPSPSPSFSSPAPNRAAEPKTEQSSPSMPPPPSAPILLQPGPPAINTQDADEEEEQTTPKASPSLIPAISNPAPSFSLVEPPSALVAPISPVSLMAPPSMPAPRLSPRPPTLSAPSSLAPPPSPSSRPQQLRQQARGPGTSTLAPPPTHSSAPTRSKAVTLQPGRSPLDWARISSGPTADLRNLPPSTPYLKITPSQLKTMNGRKGTDAWMALNGKVYNVQPYREYHPGGIPELFRGAGKDGTKIFGEVHPWVNYETMLQACLVGVLVSEEEAREQEGGGMEEMD